MASIWTRNCQGRLKLRLAACGSELEFKEHLIRTLAIHLMHTCKRHEVGQVQQDSSRFLRLREETPTESSQALKLPLASLRFDVFKFLAGQAVCRLA